MILSSRPYKSKKLKILLFFCASTHSALRPFCFSFRLRKSNIVDNYPQKFNAGYYCEPICFSTVHSYITHSALLTRKTTINYLRESEKTGNNNQN